MKNTTIGSTSATSSPHTMTGATGVAAASPAGVARGENGGAAYKENVRSKSAREGVSASVSQEEFLGMSAQQQAETEAMLNEASAAHARVRGGGK